jgi:hypothetical protein
VTQQDIAKTLGINRKTLRKHYKEILRNSTTYLDVKVAGLLVDACRNGNVQAQIFFLKTRMGWSESKNKTDDKEPKPINSITYREQNAQKSPN